MILQHLILENHGDFLGKHSERLIVTNKDGEKVAQAPLMHLEAVLICNSGISLSADAVRECAERGIPIFFTSKSGTPYASLHSSGLGATVITRRAQYAAMSAPLAVHVGIGFIRGKLASQANLLRYAAKYRKETNPNAHTDLMQKAFELDGFGNELDDFAHREQKEGHVDDSKQGADDTAGWRGQLLNIEGRAAQVYWAGVRIILPTDFEWGGRERRGARDPLNMALNYGYGVLYGQVERALILAGLDPFAGFIHTDRPGKPSLTLDLIEEFRQAVVDRTVLGLINKQVTFNQDERGFLDDKARRLLAEKVLSRLESAELYEGKRAPLRVILQTQARRLAQTLRGEREGYAPFVMGW
jgi:CRISPR-associated protein Cas1